MNKECQRVAKQLHKQDLRQSLNTQVKDHSKLVLISYTLIQLRIKVKKAQVL